ncbi:MAG: hypothetical protein LBR13_03060 [Dysgonamonadaceae bacterium]|jgi:hypothetical protein|nr:hypothetical protein [Dysgonamonadaceae bacterium]
MHKELNYLVLPVNAAYKFDLGMSQKIIEEDNISIKNGNVAVSVGYLF